MTGILLAAVTVLATFGMTAIGDMVSEEVRDRLDQLPHAILRLAAWQLDPVQRITLYEEVWQPDLAYFLKGDEARPVTRLIKGTSYALGILATARRITRHLDRPVPEQPTPVALRTRSEIVMNLLRQRVTPVNATTAKQVTNFLIDHHVVEVADRPEITALLARWQGRQVDLAELKQALERALGGWC